ncbi:MAG: 16S rRNA (guanine(527)-N(7))-methyltransferase RsmG [Gammaproteobacteria bacterium]|nr:16S rRNA (guanine(527)-N(7))-methyltransferase RsmG [Gammaproteobacteria bacterium]
MPSDLKGILTQGLSQIGLEIEASAEQRLLDFIELLAKWNRSYNLTAVRKPEQMVTRHLLDSLVIEPYLQGEQVLDVGTGAGLPGIPLAIVCPERHFTLLDSNSKKTRFVTQAVAELGLTNVDVVQSRVESFQPQGQFDTVIARAFATIGDFIAQSRHLLTRDGLFLVMKGVYPVTELDELGEEFVVEQTHKLDVPGLDAERHLIIIKAQS